jgi:hypothetical protein
MSSIAQLHAVRRFIGGSDAYATLHLGTRSIVITGSHAERIVASLSSVYPVVVK